MNQGDLALESTQLLDSMARDVPESIHTEKEVGRDDPEFLSNQASRIQDLHFKNGRSEVTKNPEMFIKYEYKNPI